MVGPNSTVVFISDDQKEIHRVRQWAHKCNYQIKTFTSLQWQSGLSNPIFQEQLLTTKPSVNNLVSGQVIPFPEPPSRQAPLEMNDCLPSGNNSVLTIDEIQKSAIQETIQKFHGNLTKTSMALGIGRATLYRKVKLYNIDLSALREKRRALKAA